MNYETAIGLALVALNAGVAAVLGEQGLQLDPLAHAALVAVSAATGAILLYIRPAMKGGVLVEPLPVVAPPAPVVQAQTATVVTAAPAAHSEYPN